MRELGALALLACGLVGAGRAGAQAQRAGATGADARGIARGVAVSPDTVTVGDPFRVIVRIRAPRGSTLEFPHAPDSGTGVEALDPVAVVPSADTSVTEQTATYRLAAWDVGMRPIRLADVVVRDSLGERRVAVGGDVSVFVSSVLPADTAQRVPRPARALYEFAPPWWWWAIVALVALGVLWLVWRLWRRRRRAAPVAVTTPLQDAEAAFARVEAMALLASGERSLHVALMADVMRSYLERVLPAATPSLTSSEVLVALRSDARLPMSRLSRLLQDVDLVKFAAYAVDAARADVIGREARSMVVAVDAALAPRASANAGTTTREAA
ncbi:MAG: hypothetical protein IT359_06535 [Gemmatimonadaceae bacterium]|nr:hypothetical protein [Gemmatimonadaceae bacterium]